MNKFEITGDGSRPSVLLDPYEQVLKIEGRSILEDAADFYQPILDWITDYVAEPFESTVLEVRLEYINTSSSKCLVDLFHSLEPLVPTANTVRINWHYNQNDDDMEDAGKDFDAVVKVPVMLCPYAD